MASRYESLPKRVVCCGLDPWPFCQVRSLAPFYLPALFLALALLILLPSPALAAGPAATPALSMVRDVYLRPVLLQPGSDLQIQKVALPNPVVAGEGTLTYILFVSNIGTADATDVVVVDTLPPDITYVSALSTSGLCSASAGEVTCPLGTVAPGTSAFIQIVVTVPPSVYGTISNSASVFSNNNPAPVAQVSQDTTVLSVADVGVTKEDDPDPVTPGEYVTYTLTVYNDGPSDAYNVTVTDLLPPEVASWTSVPDPVLGSDPPTWDLGTLTVGESKTITIVAEVASWASETFTNTVDVVVSPSEDPVPRNNVAEEPTSVAAPVADLSITKTDGTDPVAVGDQFDYTVTVYNAGPSDAPDVVVTDVLPADVTLVSAVPAPTAGSDPPSWELGDIAAGDSQDIVITVEVGPGAYQSLSNLASVTSTATDPDTGNNQATETTTVLNPTVDVSITKSDDPDPVVAGDRLTYTLTIYNNSTTAYAHDLVVVDTLPEEVTFVSSIPVRSSGPNPLTWNLGVVEIGTPQVITVVVDVKSWVTQTFTNTASVSSATIDPEPANDAVQETTDVTTEADMSIAKSDNPTSVAPGELLNYTLIALNNGPSDAHDVVVTDTLPPEVEFVSATPDPVSGPDPLTWEFETIAAGTSRNIYVVVRVPPSLTPDGNLTNVAGVSAATFDPALENNSDTEETVLLEPAADLAISKTDNPDPVQPGGFLTYTLLIENLGPSDAVGVVLADTLPPEVSFVEAFPAQDSGPNPLTWNLGALAAGDSTTVEVVAQVNGSVVTPFTNSATTSATTPDPNPGNNTVDESTVPDVDAIALQKSVDPTEVVPGMPFTYTLRITNTGAVSFASVVLTDTLPANFQYKAGSGVPSDPDVVAEPLLVWQNLGPLAPGDSMVVSFAATAPANATGSYVNEATARGSSISGQAVTSAEAALRFVAPQVAVRKTLAGVDPNPSAPNYLTFTIAITNIGPSTIDLLPLTDTYDPYYLTFVSAEPTPFGSFAGSINWLDLTGSAPQGFDRPLAPGETFVVETVFLVANQIVSATENVAVVNGGADVYDNDVPLASDTEEIVGIPTAVELLYFHATQEGGHTLLEWETAWETDNWGFNLYRSATPNLHDAEWIHFELGQGYGQLEGQFYSYLDLGAGSEGMYYWLEDIPHSGIPVMLAGPVSPRTAAYRIYLPMAHK